MKTTFLALVLAIGMVGCGGTGSEPGTEGPTLPRIDLAGLRGVIAKAAAEDKVLVVDFWATWCPPCVAMFPALHTGLEELGDRVEPVTVTLDAPGKLEVAAIAFLEQNHAMEGAYLMEPDTDAQYAIVDAFGDEWQDLVVPAILVFNQDGELAGEFLGGEAEPILNKVHELLAASTTAATSPPPGNSP